MKRSLCITTPRHTTTLASILISGLLLAACATTEAPLSTRGANSSAPEIRISVCKSTDRQIDNSSQCLQDDAACYPISNGKWCTGERGTSCPAGSVALPAGLPCPAGKRCFRIGESLECTIG